MQRRNIGLVLLGTAIGIIGLLTVQAQRISSLGNGQKNIVEKKLEDKKSEEVEAANYGLSGPYSHKNLSIFLIHGQNRTNGTAPLTLKEAMEQKKIIVHETGAVNALSIENVSQEEVYVQSGDIVKGGKQDRVLALDLIMPPKSGKVPIDSFCVEQGRWSQRGAEASAVFSASEKMLSSKELKIAAKHKASQGEVWDKVARSQSKLSAGVLASATPQSTADNERPNTRAANFSVASPTSSSSLQLSLENKDLQNTASEYIKKLSSIIELKGDIIGYAFAINGEINSADVYSSHTLFTKLWPKLLEASAIEAIGEFDKDKTYQALSTDSLMAFLKEAETGKVERNEVTLRVTRIKRETEKSLFFETLDSKQAGQWLHRNYIAK